MSDPFVTPWTVAHQASLSVGFPRQEYWNGFAFPSPVGFPDSGNEPTSPALAGGLFTLELPGKPIKDVNTQQCEIFLSKFMLPSYCYYNGQQDGFRIVSKPQDPNPFSTAWLCSTSYSYTQTCFLLTKVHNLEYIVKKTLKSVYKLISSYHSQ